MLDHPEKCVFCHNYFCYNHINPKIHNCPARKIKRAFYSVKRRVTSFIRNLLVMFILIIIIWFIVTFIWPIFRPDALIFFITNFYKLSPIDLISFDPTVLIIFTIFLIIGIIGTIFPSFLDFLERHAVLAFIFGVLIGIPLFFYGHSFFSNITTIKGLDYLQAKLSFNEINDIRKETNALPLVWDERLYELAKYRAKDMVERSYFSHYSPEGYDISNYASQFGIFNYGISENIGEGYYNVKHVIEGWKNSPGHYSNLLFGNKGAVAVHGDKYVYVSCVC